MKQVTAVMAASFVFAAAALTITPASHDFGDQGVNVPGPLADFRVTLPPGSAPGYQIEARIEQAEGNFRIYDGLLPSPDTSYFKSFCTKPDWSLGHCNWVVEFRPQSTGPKTATLVVTVEKNGQVVDEGRAALKGEGITTCRPYLVPCNWADLYSGQLTIQQVDSTVLNDPTRMREMTTVDVTIDRGVATCDVVESGFSESQYGGNILSRTSSQGVIRGPGLFAVEFEKSDGTLVYKMSLACPSVNGTSTTIDYIQGTTTTDTYPSEPADWRGAALVADYQPAPMIAMPVLSGTQQDVRQPMGDDVAGYTNIRWDLRRQ